MTIPTPNDKAMTATATAHAHECGISTPHYTCLCECGHTWPNDAPPAPIHHLPSQPPSPDALIAEAAEISAKASPAPWIYVHGYGFNFVAKLLGDGPPDADLDFIARARTLVPELAAVVSGQRRALALIAEGRGPFSRDPLTHASNVIESQIAVATRALAGTYPEIGND